MDDLLRFNFNQNYLILDTETECLNLLSTKPWQVSWLLAKGKQIKSIQNKYLKWNNLKLSEDAERITKFDRNLYERKCEDPKKVLEELLKYLLDPSYIIIGQNILGFDVYVLNIWMKLSGFTPDYSYVSRILDTRSIAMAIGTGYKDLSKDDILAQYRFLNLRDKKIKSSQGYLLKKYNIDHDPSKLHDALYDIEMTFKIFWEQIQEINI